MYKFSSFNIIITFLFVLTIFATFGESQVEQSATAETSRSRTRTKLASALRKKKPGKTKVAEADMIKDTAIDINESSTTTIDNLLTIEPEVIEEKSTSTTQKPIKNKPASDYHRQQSRTGHIPSDCGECEQEDCNTPSETACPTGLVLDRCSCCFICGALEGNRCYNSSLNLPYNPEVGICGNFLDCLLRNDLDPNEPKEALCECRDKRIVCGNDRNTYISECKLREAAHNKPGLVVNKWSPCVSAPVITTVVENATAAMGEDVSLSCEVRGYPAPVLHWEFRAEDSSSNSPLILPGDDSGIVVVVRGGPEQIMTTSWIQIIAVDPKRQGTYYCVAKNTEGMVQTAGEVRVYKTSDGDHIE